MSLVDQCRMFTRVSFSAEKKAVTNRRPKETLGSLFTFGLESLFSRLVSSSLVLSSDVTSLSQGRSGESD